MKISETVHRHWLKHLLFTLIILFAFLMSVSLTKADFTEIITNADQMGQFLSRFLQPDFSYIPNLIGPMFKTLGMSLVGTFMGVILAIPIALLATTFVTDNIIVTTIVKFILGMIRTIPTLLLAALMVAIVGIGELTGVLTITIFTFGMVSQLIYESIETIDLGPIESAVSVGANKLQIIFWSIFPQVINNIVSYSLYAFEVNVRASTILGYVGAGGIGVLLSSQLALLRYNRASIIILMILLVVIIVDALSEFLRERLS